MQPRLNEWFPLRLGIASSGGTRVADRAIGCRSVLPLAAVLVAAMFCGIGRAADEEQVGTLLRRAQTADGQGQWQAGKTACDAALKLDAKLAVAYYLRGRAQFCLGAFKQSVADFDRYVELQPAAASRQWERGISCYYAGQFEAGAKQFALYQTYHANDVENSVWRYLCMARTKPADGGDPVAAAREAMLPIRNDRRQAMMKIYDLYRGKATVADVLRAARPDEDEGSTGPMFYARLYIGLYHEANGRPEEARRFIRLAAEKHQEDAQQDRINHYMYQVAVVHDQRLNATKPEGAKGSKGER